MLTSKAPDTTDRAALIKVAEHLVDLGDRIHHDDNPSAVDRRAAELLHIIADELRAAASRRQRRR